MELCQGLGGTPWRSSGAVAVSVPVSVVAFRSGPCQPGLSSASCDGLLGFARGGCLGTSGVRENGCRRNGGPWWGRREPEETRQDVWASLVFDSVSEELLEAREASWFRLESWKIALYNILTVFMDGVCYICPGCVYLHARCTVLVPEYIEVHAREHILKVHPRFTQLSARLRWSFQVCPETRWDCQDIFARFPVLLRSNTQLNNVSATTNDDNVGSSPGHWDWDPHENALRP